MAERQQCLEGRGLSFRYGHARPWLFQNLDIQINAGEVVGMPGPSGRGKSTLARILAGYLRPTTGNVLLNGQPLPSGASPVQLLFQHPELAVNPRWTGRNILEEAGPMDPLLLEQLAVDHSWLARYPHELSGGELQRLCLARALQRGTRCMLCDEMTSMLDALTQAAIWNAVLEIARHRELGLLVISHDVALLSRICTRQEHFFLSP